MIPSRSSSSYARFTVITLTIRSAASTRKDGSAAPGGSRPSLTSRFSASTIC